MVRYLPYKDRKLRLTRNPRLRSRILQAKLHALVGDKPTLIQELMILGIVPLALKLQDWTLEFERTNELHPDFARTQGQVQAALNRLQASIETSSAGNKGSGPALDLSAVLGE